MSTFHRALVFAIDWLRDRQRGTMREVFEFGPTEIMLAGAECPWPVRVTVEILMPEQEMPLPYCTTMDIPAGAGVTQS